MSISKRSVLACLTREQLLEFVQGYRISGVIGKTKDVILDALAVHKALTLEKILRDLKRAELKNVCDAHGLDDSGRELEPIIQRILAAASGPAKIAAAASPDPKSTPKKPRKPASNARDIDAYEHSATRVNNPPVGLVTPATDPVDGVPTPSDPADDGTLPRRPTKQAPKKVYQYDPHLDPQLVWAGKAERTSFEIPTVSLHVHERIDPKTIIEAVRAKPEDNDATAQLPLFERAKENPPLRDAVDFYKHAHNWSNRLVLGDSLLVMNSLLEKEGMAGKVQMIYFDPPYGIKYGSNFQPFVNKRDVTDGKDEDLTQEPEMVKAFRDTWELGIHSYLSYIRDRLLLARELLTESGSVFVQISDENLHHLRELADEVFGSANFVSLVTFKKTTSSSSGRLGSVSDYLLWYSRSISTLKERRLLLRKAIDGLGGGQYRFVELQTGERRKATEADLQNPSQLQFFRYDTIVSQRPSQGADVRQFKLDGKVYTPGKGTFKTDLAGLEALARARRVSGVGDTLCYVRYFDDFPAMPLSNMWTDTTTSGFSDPKRYVVQTQPSVIARCLLMTTDPGDLVLDPTCGSGTTAFVAEQWGRRWITCDTSRVALTLAKQRLMSAVFDYHKLAKPAEGVAGNFQYETVPHVTLKSIAHNPEIKPGMTREQIKAAIDRHAVPEALYDKPKVDATKARVTGPFTVEAVPAPSVMAIDAGSANLPETDVADAKPGGTKSTDTRPPRRGGAHAADASIARSTSVLRHEEWRDELLRSGVRLTQGGRLMFNRIEPMQGTRWLHAEGTTKSEHSKGLFGDKRVAISFGPEHAALEQRQVELAWAEARELGTPPAFLIFVAFEFDPEASKDIDEMDPAKAGMKFLKVRMNADMLTDDLKKKRSSNESFFLVGQPEASVRTVKTEEGERFVVEVEGFDYYDPRTGEVSSGGPEKIAMWLLDTDYDGRSLYPRQVFFPMAGSDEGWAKLAKNLRAEIDEELIEKYRGTQSIPFAGGRYKRAAVKIIDDRGIESIKVMTLEPRDGARGGSR